LFFHISIIVEVLGLSTRAHGPGAKGLRAQTATVGP